MPPTRNVRRAAFASFVKRALAHAREAGMTIVEIERRTGVSKSSFYRWRDGGWTREPRASQVMAFCTGLGIPVQAAYKVLGWSDDGPAEAEAMPIDPDFQILLRRLRDPNVPDSEKYLIKETIRSLAARSPERPTRQSRTG